MNAVLAGLAGAFQLWAAILIIGIVISWVPAFHRPPLDSLLGAVVTVTSPLVAPLRRICRVSMNGVVRDFSICAALLVYGIVAPTLLLHFSGQSSTGLPGWLTNWL